MKTKEMEHGASDVFFVTLFTVLLALCWFCIGIASSYITFIEELLEFAKHFTLCVFVMMYMWVVGLVVFFRLKELSYWKYTLAHLSVVTVMYALSFPEVGRQLSTIVLFFLFGFLGIVLARIVPATR